MEDFHSMTESERLLCDDRWNERKLKKSINFNASIYERSSKEIGCLCQQPMEPVSVRCW